MVNDGLRGRLLLSSKRKRLVMGDKIYFNGDECKA